MKDKSTKEPPDIYAKDASQWITAAECTYRGAMELFNSEDPLLYIPAGYLGHHALEMKLKAALIKLGYTVAKGELKNGYAWGHELAPLLRRSHLTMAMPFR